jgi:hypothetical protein
MIPTPHYIKNIINSIYNGPSPCADRSLKPHHNQICELAEKILKSPESAKEEDLIDLAEQLHFIPSKGIKAEFKKKLDDATKGILNSNDEIFNEIQPKWNEFWKDYNHLINNFPVHDQDPELLKSLTAILPDLRKDQIKFLDQLLLAHPPNQRKEIFFILSKYLHCLNTRAMNILLSQELAILQQFGSLANENWTGNEINSTLSIITTAPPLVKKLFESGISKEFLLKCLMNIPQDERSLGFQVMEKLLENAKDDFDKKVILEIVSQLSREDKTKIVDLVEQYPIKDLKRKMMGVLMGVFFYPNLISMSTMKKVYKVQITNIALGLKRKYGHEAIDIIKDVKPLINDRRSLPDDVHRAVENVLSKRAINKAIQELEGQIPPSVIEELIIDQGQEAALPIFQDAKPFIKKGMSPTDIGEVFSLLASIPRDKRKIVACQAIEFAGKRPWTDLMTVLYILTKTPNALRDECLNQLKAEHSEKGALSEKIVHYLTYVHTQQLEKFSNPLLTPFKELDDFENPIEIEPESILAKTILIPSDSRFAKTDLIVFSDDVQKDLPLNGINKAEFNKMEQLAEEIFSGKAKIKIDPEHPQFQQDAEEYIITLLTRPLGRKLIKKVMENDDIKSLRIDLDLKSSLSIPHKTNPELFIGLAPKSKRTIVQGLTQTGQVKSYHLPQFLALGHELIHASHFPHILETVKEVDRDYSNKEEKITITGFNSFPEDGEADDIYDEGFDLLNERNLHAQFANSKNIFYPRINHNEGRESEDKDLLKESYSRMEQKVMSHLFYLTDPQGVCNQILAKIQGES